MPIGGVSPALVDVRLRQYSRPAVSIRVVTWNLHGSAQPDVGEVGELLRASGADVVALQEVQRRPARTLAAALGSVTAEWSFKHWPLPTPAEGLAVLSAHRLVDARTITLSKCAPPWSYRRRIAQLCALEVGGQTLRLVNCHLANDDADARLAQAQRLLTQHEPGSFVAGDLNARPGGRVLRLLRDAGLRDARAEAHPDAADDYIDYILVPEGWRVVDAWSPSAADSDLAMYRRLSDHLPVRADFEISA
jgi:endonuclease/exonuclease/phosphatase family metal-dependent hydrolase